MHASRYGAANIARFSTRYAVVSRIPKFPVQRYSAAAAAAVSSPSESSYDTNTELSQEVAIPTVDTHRGHPVPPPNIGSEPAAGIEGSPAVSVDSEPSWSVFKTLSSAVPEDSTPARSVSHLPFTDHTRLVSHIMATQPGGRPNVPPRIITLDTVSFSSVTVDLNAKSPGVMADAPEPALPKEDVLVSQDTGEGNIVATSKKPSAQPGVSDGIAPLAEQAEVATPPTSTAQSPLPGESAEARAERRRIKQRQRRLRRRLEREDADRKLKETPQVEETVTSKGEAGQRETSTSTTEAGASKPGRLHGSTRKSKFRETLYSEIFAEQLTAASSWKAKITKEEWERLRMERKRLVREYTIMQTAIVAQQAKKKNGELILSDPFMAGAVELARKARAEAKASFAATLEASAEKPTGTSDKVHDVSPDSPRRDDDDLVPIGPVAPPHGVKGKDKNVAPLMRSPVTGNYIDRDEYYDEFARKDIPKVEDGRPPLPLSYKRRVEGLISPVDMKQLSLKDVDSPSEQRPIARLAHGLDRVLFNPGVYWLQDPRSSVFNFTPWLQNVPKVQDFDFDRVTGFIKSSKDSDLWTLAKQQNCKFAGSTSSLTGMLSHIYMMLSRERWINVTTLSSAFSDSLRNFTPGQKLPVSLILNYHDGVYSTDSHPSDPGSTDRNVLTWMGTMLEKFLTVEEADFNRYRRDAPPIEPDPEDEGRREAYRYAQFGNYMVRSQLDCYDPRLPGTGVFDIKTRAALPIRIDLMNWEENSGYQIRSLQGDLESFEREYYDLIRSAFLKYSFQARIGNMDGVFVTYHNTAQIFGFQYVPLTEMDECLYGNKRAGQQIFERCLKMLEVINTEITSHFPERSIAMLWDSYPEKGILRVWAEPYGKQGIKPGEKDQVMEFEVHAINYLGDKPTHGANVATAIPDTDWTVHYKIFVSSQEQSVIRARQQQVREKQSTYWALPSGVAPDKAAKYWRDINYGGRKASPSTRIPFRNVDPRTQALRELARKGKKEAEQKAKEAEGKRKIVWGMPEGMYGAGDEAGEVDVEGADVEGADVEGADVVVANVEVADLELEAQVATEAEAKVSAESAGTIAVAEAEPSVEEIEETVVATLITEASDSDVTPESESEDVQVLAAEIVSEIFAEELANSSPEDTQDTQTQDPALDLLAVHEAALRLEEEKPRDVRDELRRILDARRSAREASESQEQPAVELQSKPESEPREQ